MVSLERIDRDGWQVLRITSDEIAVEVVPGHGGTILSVRRRRDDCELLWQTPWGLRPAGAGRLTGAVEAAMLDTHPGGWQTIFPNGSDNAIVHGVEWGYDGEARIAFYRWEETPSSVIMRARLTRSPFEVTKIVSVRGAEVTVGETIKNVGAEHVDVVWGQQVNLGPPLVGPRAIVDADVAIVRADPRAARDADFDDLLPWPRSRTGDGVVNLRSVPAPDAEQTRAAYLSDFGRPAITIRNPAAGIAATLTWDGDVWPHLWYGMEAGGRSGYPWYGAGYFLSLTPATSWPARGIHDVRRTSATTLRVYPGVSRTSHLSLRVD